MTEQQEQELLVQYLELKGIKFSALPLDTFSQHWSVKNRNKRIGVRPGVPDLLCIVKDRLLFIEMKKEKGGRLTENQKNWIETLNKCRGVRAYVARGFEEAKKLIDKNICRKT